ncbi:MAG: tRNA (5-methylaminomethyl-2-thiouridine)(34)-methyltransferase MnmD [Planctomycetota bacterium]|nr:tRNA (5-methylaminomethyl-2-thiouridine)(34)-methyltransferase MnmD [Planctomycetota bacterium]
MVERPVIEIPNQSDWVIQITDDGSRTLINPTSRIAFHSASGALAETLHVYLENSGVGTKLRQGSEVQVIEIGLGTALGMLITIDHALSNRAPLRYHAYECNLLDWEVIKLLQIEQHLQNPWIVDDFLHWIQELGDSIPHGKYHWSPGSRIGARAESPDLKDPTPASPALEVTITLGDCVTELEQGQALVDAIYYDPFAPVANPELWTVEALRRARSCLKPGGLLTSYCVSRLVRERFQSAGFDVERVRGPVGGKREVLIACNPELS